MRILALIAARAGSRGLADKNVRRLGGQPLLTHAIELALRSRAAREDWHIAVSTESQRYARIARAAGADVIARPKRLASAKTPLIDVVLHAIDDTPCDLVVLLSATTPLTVPADVRRALAAWRKYRVGVATVCRDTPSALRFTTHANGRLQATSPSPPGRRQEAPPVCRLNGAVYVATPRWLENHGRFVVAGQSVGVAMPPQRSLDIDDADDLAMVTALWNAR